MSPLRVLIVDDEPLARRRVRVLLEHAPDVLVQGECTGGREAVTALERHDIDLVFLDVRMPDLDGFQVIEAVGIEAMPVVVFVTALGDRALEAFDLHAVDYLLKPFEDERFGEALERARRRVRQSEGEELRRSLQELLAGTAADPPRKPSVGQRLHVRAGGTTTFLEPAEVLWIEAEGTYVRIHTGKRSYLQRETMQSLEQSLADQSFIRIHRSRIVNLQHVRELRKREAEHVVVLVNGTRLGVSERHAPKLREALGL